MCSYNHMNYLPVTEMFVTICDTRYTQCEFNFDYNFVMTVRQLYHDVVSIWLWSHYGRISENADTHERKIKFFEPRQSQHHHNTHAQRQPPHNSLRSWETAAAAVFSSSDSSTYSLEHSFNSDTDFQPTKHCSKVLFEWSQQQQSTYTPMQTPAKPATTTITLMTPGQIRSHITCYQLHQPPPQQTQTRRPQQLILTTYLNETLNIPLNVPVTFLNEKLNNTLTDTNNNPISPFSPLPQTHRKHCQDCQYHQLRCWDSPKTLKFEN